MHVQAVGVFCLGLFIGYLSWYFVVRIGKGQVTADTFAAVVGVIAGGVVIGLLKDFLTAKPDAWWYPIGLVAGFALYVVASAINKVTGGGFTPPVRIDAQTAVFPTSMGLFKEPG
jgi:multisubunit Na+/H+ antiporter MnhE subunit